MFMVETLLNKGNAVNQWVEIIRFKTLLRGQRGDHLVVSAMWGLQEGEVENDSESDSSTEDVSATRRPDSILSSQKGTQKLP